MQFFGKCGCNRHDDPILSQCTAFREVRNPIVNSCSNVKDVTIDEFESVLKDSDVSRLKQLEESNDVLATSFVESSFHSDSTDDENNFSSTNSPHVPFSVEEVSLVKSLACWSNRNVRVIGTVSPPSNPESTIWSLNSIGEEGGPFSVAVDMKLLNPFPQAYSQVQIFGEVQVVNKSDPLILAKLFRDFSAVDIYHYQKVTEKLHEFVPHFINSKSVRRLHSSNRGIDTI